MMSEAIREALREVIDPELGINIVDLGLIYDVHVEDTRARVVMTMTSPACPLKDYFEDLVDLTVKARIPGVRHVEVEFVFDPPWTPEMMSQEGRRRLDPDER